MSGDLEQQEELLRFWLGSKKEENDPDQIKLRSKRWYVSTPQFDEEIRDAFGDLVEKAVQEQLLHWCTDPRGTLAHVILLDQFTRNVYRGSARAFSGDVLARAIALRAYKRRQDQELSLPGRLFLYHPFHHSELPSDQEFACQLLQELLEDEQYAQWSDLLKSSQPYFESHLDIVRRFSRFPHRNEVLGRTSTPEEEEYLRDARRFGQ